MVVLLHMRRPCTAPLSPALLLLFSSSLLLGCAGGPEPETPPANPKAFVENPDSDEEEEEDDEDSGPKTKLAWSPKTYSPRPGSPVEPDLDPLIEICGTGDTALHDTADFVARKHQASGEAPGLDEVNFHLRRHGSPYVMPRLWSANLAGVSDEDLAAHVRKWAKAKEPLGEFRCGAGMVTNDDGSRTISLIQTDVLAEMMPLPTLADAGDWFDLKVGFLIPTTAATVVLLPPDGAPKSVATESEGSTAKARFSLTAPGTWLVQVMATVVGGPRPVLSALITVGEERPSAVDEKEAPGEDAYDDKASPADALFGLINATRKEHGLPRLTRSRVLDQVARAHSNAMLKAGRIGHDTGQGDPGYRVSVAGLSPKATGENVAMAQSVLRLHRVLWASPSHRENLLLRRWDTVGVAIAERPDGALFATQLFTDEQ